jgi:hypothetical protein
VWATGNQLRKRFFRRREKKKFQEIVTENLPNLMEPLGKCRDPHTQTQCKEIQKAKAGEKDWKVARETVTHSWRAPVRSQPNRRGQWVPEEQLFTGHLYPVKPPLRCEGTLSWCYRESSASRLPSKEYRHNQAESTVREPSLEAGVAACFPPFLTSSWCKAVYT